MPVWSSAVGASLTPWTGVLDARWLMAFAAGLGRDEPAVYDTAAGVVGHPVFAVSPEWQLLTSQPARYEQLGLSSRESLRGVHAGHDLQLHRPVAQDTRVEIAAQVMGVQATTAGALVTQWLQARADDEPLWTTWMRTLFRGVSVVGPDAVAGEPPPAPHPPASGSTRTTSVELGRHAPHVYSACARIWNPIHTDIAVARSAGLPDLVLHGTATLAHGVDAALDALDAGFGDVRRLGGEFRAMVRVPSTLTCDVVAHDGIAHFVIRNSDGGEALSGGFVVAEAAR